MERDYSKAISYLTAAGGQQTGYGRMSGRMRDVRASALFLLGEAMLDSFLFFFSLNKCGFILQEGGPVRCRVVHAWHVHH